MVTTGDDGWSWSVLIADGMMVCGYEQLMFNDLSDPHDYIVYHIRLSDPINLI